MKITGRLTWAIAWRGITRAVLFNVGLFAMGWGWVKYQKVREDDFESWMLVVGLVLCGLFFVVSAMFPSEEKEVSND